MRLRAIARWRLLALACLVHAPLAQAVPSFGEVRQDFSSSETRVLSREGELLQRVRTDSTVRRGDWVALGDVSAALRTAMLLSEDKRFYEHSGVDWAAVTSAAWGNLWNQRTRGASTISMQLAGLLDGDWRRSNGGRSVGQKVGQTVAAQVLDRRWQKTQILEAYLNLVPFRGELVGIDALSRTLFDKAPHGLDDREAVLAWQLMPGLRGARRWQLPILLGSGVALAWASLWTHLVPLGEAARLLALALLVAWLQWRGWPVDPQGIVQRVLRVLGVVVIYLLARPLIEWLAYRLPLPDAPITEVFWHTVGTLLILGGGVALARWIPRQR